MKDKVFFSNSRGFMLSGILSNPLDDTKVPVVTLCHGFSTSKDGRTYIRLEETLNREGLATFRFDFFGHGESEGKFEDITISEAVHDVFRAVHVLKDSGYSKIGLMGSSFGGMASLLSASELPDLNALALKSPVSDYLGLLIANTRGADIQNWKKTGSTSVTGSNGQNLKINYSFYEDAEKIKSCDAIKKIKAPTLIVHGDKDKTVPLEQSIRCARMIADCRLDIIEGADHTYTQPRHFERMLSLIAEFLIEKCAGFASSVCPKD
jgi:dipeptidyl aminopeptidase/acylaminoacyl peptidase